MPQKSISVIYPTFNERHSVFLIRNLSSFKKIIKKFEVIIVDGGSADGTVELCEQYGLEVISLPRSTRMGRLKKGIEHSCGKIIVLHHPRSFVNEKGWEELEAQFGNNIWGGFTHKFDKKSLPLRFTSWYSNYVRLDLRGICYLDHCLFFNRDLIDESSIRDEPIFEDTLLSYQLNRINPPTRLSSIVETSAIRFEINGFWKQALRNQLAKLKFLLRQDFSQMNKKYEKGLNLN